MLAPVMSINESAPQISALRALILIAIRAAGPRSAGSCARSSALRFKLIDRSPCGKHYRPMVVARSLVLIVTHDEVFGIEGDDGSLFSDREGELLVVIHSHHSHFECGSHVITMHPQLHG